jgi:hypothetical protein
MRIFAPSPTVRASATPLYLQGFPAATMGQTDTIFDPGVPGALPLDSGLPVITDPLIAQGFTPQEADLIDAAAANGLITDVQFQNILSGNHSYEEIANMIFGASYQTPSGPTIAQAAIPSHGQTAAEAAAALKAGTAVAGALAPGTSPRVATRPPGQAAPGSSPFALLRQQAIPGLPNWALLAFVSGVMILGVNAKSR